MPYYLGARMAQAKKWGRETLSGGGLKNKQFNDFLPASDPLTGFFEAPSTTRTPRVLKDGSDSVGALGALNRVYINIGVFSEEWLLHFRPLLGGMPISPIPLATAQANSAYWLATEMQTPAMARFLLAGGEPHYLKDAPGGPGYLSTDAPTLDRGKVVFAERCARCHSTKLPDLPAGLDLENANGPNYLAAWNAYWELTKTDAFKAAMRQKVQASDFLENNFLSTELRVPVTLLGSTRAARSPRTRSATTSGTTSRPSRTSRCPRPAPSRFAIRSPARKWTIRCRPGGAASFGPRRS